MPFTIINGQMVDVAPGYNPLTTPGSGMYQPPGVVQAANAGTTGWQNANIVAPPNPWGYQYDPGGQMNVPYADATAYRDWASLRGGQLPQYRGPTDNFGLAAQQYSAGTLQPQTVGGQAQMAQNLAPPPAPAIPNDMGRGAQAPASIGTPPPAAPTTSGRSTPGGSANTISSGQAPAQPQVAAPQVNPVQQLQQTGYGVPFTSNFIPPQAFSPGGGGQGGLDLYGLLNSILGGMGPQMGGQGYGGNPQQFSGPQSSVGMSAPAGGFGGLGGMAYNPQTGMAQGVGSQANMGGGYGSSFGGYQQPYQTQMFNPFGGQAQQQQGPNLTQLLLALLGGGR